MIRTYSELKSLKTFEDRFEYLRVGALVGQETFGFERYQNQRFYNSYEFKRVRDEVIARDGGYDLGSIDRPINGRVIVHHMNPMTIEMLEEGDDTILNPEYLISCSLLTHNCIHFGTDEVLRLPTERKPGDTKLW